MNTWNAIFEYVSTLYASLQSVHFVVLGLVVCGESTPIYDTCTHVKVHTFKIHKAGIH